MVKKSLIEGKSGFKICGAILERSDRSNYAPLHQNFDISLYRSAPFNSLRGVKRSDDSKSRSGVGVGNSSECVHWNDKLPSILDDL